MSKMQLLQSTALHRIHVLSEAHKKFTDLI
jgi:hypothetical protein